MPYKDPAVRAAYLREWQARNVNRRMAWEAEHRHERLARKRELHRINRPREREAMREYRARFGPDFWSVYGHRLERGELAALLDFQDGRCAICGVERRLQIDHDHLTGERRGLLCKPCNGALGVIEGKRRKTRRDGDWLSRAAAYLAEPSLRRMRRGSVTLEKE